MDVKKALKQLPDPNPAGQVRVWDRFERSRAEQRGGLLSGWGLRAGAPSLALLSTAALLVVALLPEGERSLVLDAAESGTVAWSEQVDLSFSGTGSVSGTSRDLIVNWEAGTLRAEVEPNTGTGLSVVTEEAEISVVGTVFAVRRDALGVTTWVDRGKVEVRCADGPIQPLVPSDPPLTCLPTRPGMLLGRADALRDQGADAESILEALNRGIQASDGRAPEVHSELLARRMELLSAQGQVDAALEDADAYLAHDEGTGRSDEVRRFAGWLALGQRGCDRAVPYLEGLHTPRDQILLGECLVDRQPDRARELLEAARRTDLDPEWAARATAGLRALDGGQR